MPEGFDINSRGYAVNATTGHISTDTFPLFADLSSRNRSTLIDAMRKQVQELTAHVRDIERQLEAFAAYEQRAHATITTWMDTHSAHHRANNADMETFWHRLRWILFGDAGPQVRAHKAAVK